MLELEGILNMIRTLNAQGVRYLLIGGVAMRLHGSALLTEDIDICYARDTANLEALVRAFSEHKPRLRGVPEDVPFLWDARTIKNGLNFTLITDIGDIDMLGEVAGTDSFAGLWERSVEMEVYGAPLRVASLEDLISMKRAANRPKDQAHLMELEALRKLIQSEAHESHTD